MTETSILPGADAWSAEGSGAAGAVGVAVVHGFTGNPNSTRPLGERLAAEGYTVLVPRLPGHGTHWRDLARTRYRDWVRMVDDTTTELAERCQKVVLVGLSMGGTLCLDVGSRRARELAGVAVINPQILHPDKPLAKLSPVLQYVVPAVPRDLAGLPSDDIAKEGADERAYGMIPAKAAQSLIREFPRVRAQLIDLDLPVLVAYAPEDHTVPARNAQRLIELLDGRDVTTVVCDRSFHVVTLDHDAEKLEQAVLEFVSAVTG